MSSENSSYKLDNFSIDNSPTHKPPIDPSTVPNFIPTLRSKILKKHRIQQFSLFPGFETDTDWFINSMEDRLLRWRSTGSSNILGLNDVIGNGSHPYLKDDLGFMEIAKGFEPNSNKENAKEESEQDKINTKESQVYGKVNNLFGESTLKLISNLNESFNLSQDELKNYQYSNSFQSLLRIMNAENGGTTTGKTNEIKQREITSGFGSGDVEAGAIDVEELVNIKASEGTVANAKPTKLFNQQKQTQESDDDMKAHWYDALSIFGCY